MDVSDFSQIVPRIQLQSDVIDQLAVRVRSVIAETRQLRQQSRETRRQVEESAHQRRTCAALLPV